MEFLKLLSYFTQLLYTSGDEAWIEGMLYPRSGG